MSDDKGGDKLLSLLHSKAAEDSLLGALLLDNTAFASIANIVGWSHFFIEEHQTIYRHVVALIEEGKAADIVTVAESLKEAGKLDAVGGAAYLGALAQNTPSALNIRRYAELVAERAQQRGLVATLSDLLERAARPGVDADEVRRVALSRIEALRPMREKEVAHLLERAFWVRDVKLQTALPYVVKGLFGRGHIVVMWGAPGSGKTFVMMEMACAVGVGAPWHGRRTKRGTVLYVAAESSRHYIENRLVALKERWSAVAEADVIIVPLTLDLLHEAHGDVERVIETARKLAELGDVALIVIDTLAVTFGGGDENSSDMGQYVANIQRIRDATGTAVLIVHHSGKDEAKGMRGHSSLIGAIDAELAVEGKPGDERILRTGKVRDGDGFTDLFAFKLQMVELGTDQDGDPVRSCVIEALDKAGTQRVRRERKGAALGKNQKAALRVLEERGGRMVRTDLAYKLKDDGMPRNRVHDAIGGLLDSGMLIAHNDLTPPEVSLP